MNKISRKNKAKATAILASIIWGATVLTGCPSPITPESQTQYPDTLTTQEMDNVEALSTSTLADSLASMDKIISIEPVSGQSSEIKTNKEEVKPKKRRL